MYQAKRLTGGFSTGSGAGPVLCAWVVFCITTPVHAERYHFSGESSRLEVLVPRAGLLSALGHDHHLVAGSFKGTLEMKNDVPNLALEVSVADLAILDDVSEKTRATITSHMLAQAVLDAGAYPVVRFASTRIEITAPGQWEVTGDLEIRGLRRSLTFQATVDFPQPDRMAARGELTLRPRDFGIKPVKALGGTVRTASEITLRFDISGIRNQALNP